jgi:hypothetical protein
VDVGKYKVEHKATEVNLAKDWTFNTQQTERRSIYFEGIPEVYMNGSQPNPDANRAQND